MTETVSSAPDPWASSSSDSPERSDARLGAIKRELARPRRNYAGLFFLVILVVMLGDQLSKAWFVYVLGTHARGSFADFLGPYFSLFAGFGPKSQLVTTHYFPPHLPLPVFGEWVRWLLTTNTGAAWSMFAGNSLALSAVSIIIASALYLFWRATFRGNLWMSVACGAIIGGALGNFIDRFRLHEVVDFISVRIPLIGKLIPALGDPYDFPIFNVADASAVCGTIGLAIYLIAVDIALARRKKARQAERRQLLAQAALKAADDQRRVEAEKHRTVSLREAAGEPAVSQTPIVDRADEHEGGEDAAEAIELGVSATDPGVMSFDTGDSGDAGDAPTVVL